MDDYFCGKHKIRDVPMGTNYECMRKGVGVGSRVKLPRGYIPESRDPRKSLYCGDKSRAPYGKHRGSPYECFQKGFGIGKKLQVGRRGRYRGGYEFDWNNELIAVIVGLVMFGLLWLLDVQMIWSIIAGAIIAVIFYYFCSWEE